MSQSPWNITSFRGTISPARYFAFGFFLTALKLGLDFVVASRVFHRQWSPMNYAFTGEIGGLMSLDESDKFFYATMLAIALPFLVVGLALTVRRLRDAGWPIWLVAVFFAPIPINVVFMLVLSVMPSRQRDDHSTLNDLTDVPDAPKAGWRSKPRAERPRVVYLRALLSIVIPLPIAAAVVYLGTHYFRDYGWSLFVGIPFVLPMISVVIYGYHREVSMAECISVGLLWTLAAIVVLVATAFEGLICIIMMLPLAVPIVVLGALVGYFIVGIGHLRPRDSAKVMLLLFAVLPTMVGAEHITLPKPLFFVCETSVVIDAPPEKVWRNVVSFSDLDPPHDWLFRSGVAYPIRAKIEGTGVGAIRRCEFSTGTFVEPIEVWDEPRRLRFSVTSNPPSMREWNPLFEIHPPHLDGFLVSKQGQFLLTPLPGGKTLLSGSTLYQHGLCPASYWRLWSDPIIHRIHNRVLTHIKTLSEK